MHQQRWLGLRSLELVVLVLLEQAPMLLDQAALVAAVEPEYSAGLRHRNCLFQSLSL